MSLASHPARTDAGSVYASICDAARTADAALASVACALADAQIEREAGMPSELALANGAGITARDARAIHVVADALRQMPRTRALVLDGHITYSQAKAIAYEVRSLTSADKLLADAFVGRIAPSLESAEPSALSDQVGFYVARLTARTQARDDDRVARNEFLWMQQGLDGGVRLFGELATTTAATLVHALDSIADRPVSPDEPAAPSRASQHARALGRMAEMILAGGPTASGPSRPRLYVTIDARDLAEAARAEGARINLNLPGGAARISPELARMLGCDAELVPAIFDGATPLNFGPARKTIPDKVREAVLVRDGGCRWPEHDSPPGWCDVHHTVPGCHDPDTLGSFCRPCHWRIHHSGWDVKALGNGALEFRRGRQRLVSQPRGIPLRE